MGFRPGPIRRFWVENNNRKTPRLPNDCNDKVRSGLPSRMSAGSKPLREAPIWIRFNHGHNISLNKKTARLDH